MEYILDFTNLYVLYPIYAGVFISLILKFLLVWAKDDTKVESLSNKLEFSLTINDIQIQRKSRIVPNPLLIWMIKFIRNKSGSRDDLADLISL